MSPVDRAPSTASRQPLGTRGPAEAGTAVTGRLLLVGLAAGTGVGALAGAVINTPQDWRGDYATWLPFFGAVVGLLAGAATQVLTAIAVHVARHQLPDRLLVAAAPCAVAGASAWAVATGTVSTTHGLLAAAAAAAAAAVIALATRAWCLRPLSR